jgi:uncharacterized membrane protein YagU involved in acid resistance
VHLFSLQSMQQKNHQVLSAIVLGGVIAATIDIAAASLITGRSPVSIMQVIAGGLLGKASRDGGIATVILGAVLQEIMGVLIAAIYVVFSKTVPGLLRRWIPSGLVYGVIIFFVMNYVVLPLSAWKSAPHFTTLKFAENMAAMLVFGLIVAFFGRGLMSALPARDEAATAA